MSALAQSAAEYSRRVILDRDPDSLDDLTFGILWESPWETPLWEVFWQTQSTGDEVSRVEAILGDFHSEGIFTFVRRPMSEPDAQTTELTPAEVTEAITDSRYRDPITLIGEGVWIIPTDRYWAWRKRVEEDLGS